MSEQTLANVEEDPILADPVIRLIYLGRAKSLDEAEELYLDESMPEILSLVGSSMSNAELQEHPLPRLLYSRRMRRREDSRLLCPTNVWR
jgi:hypothetical protein